MRQDLFETGYSHLENPYGVCAYMDDYCVGAIAELAMRRGGASTHKANTVNLMDRCRALFYLVDIWVQWMKNHPPQQQQPITKNQ